MRRTAYYPHLPPGAYSFRVIAANSDGVWNNEGAGLGVVVPPPFYRAWWFLGLAGLGVAGTVWLVFRLRVARLERERSAPQAFSRQLIETQEGERKRIAAELHDGLGQNLLVIRNRALIGLHLGEAPDRTIAQLDEISAVASQTIEEVRAIAANLHPCQLERLGLTKAVKAMINKVASASPIHFHTEIEAADGLLDQAAEINLYRIIQESLNNIVKHSGATEARVAVKREAPGLLITIADNGRGFIPAATRQTGGFGLTGMSERARMIGGTQTVHSVPGQGTTLSIKIPIAQADSSD